MYSNSLSFVMKCACELTLGLFPQLCTGSVIISTDLDHYLSQAHTVLSVNILMQAEGVGGKWFGNTEPCEDAVAITTYNMWL